MLPNETFLVPKSCCSVFTCSDSSSVPLQNEASWSERADLWPRLEGHRLCSLVLLQPADGVVAHINPPPPLIGLRLCSSGATVNSSSSLSSFVPVLLIQRDSPGAQQGAPLAGVQPSTSWCGPPRAPRPQLTGLPCPHDDEPIPRSAWGHSARSDSSDSAGDPGRPRTGWSRASCHSCPRSTAARRAEQYCLH